MQQPPLLHNRTSQLIEMYVNKPTQGLLLTGSKGVGKSYIAHWLGTRLDAKVATISPEENKDAIGIEQIRELYRLTRTGGKLVVLIEDAGSMSKDAQNAFLKLLEEPPKDTRFILTAKNTDEVLPTILSRCQHIDISPPTTNDLLSAFGDSAQTRQLIHTLGRLPGALSKHTEQATVGDSHQEMVDTAKQFYAASPYERNIMLIEAKFDKDYLTKLLDILAAILEVLLATNANNPDIVKKCVTQSTLLEETAHAIRRVNGNPKIHLTRLAMNL